MATLRECYEAALNLGEQLESLVASTPLRNLDMERVTSLIDSREKVLAEAAQLRAEGHPQEEAQEALRLAVEQQARLEQRMAQSLAELQADRTQDHARNRSVRDFQNLMRSSQRSRMVNEKR